MERTLTHLSYRPAGTHLELDADVVVVGSGAGGAACAHTLAQAGLSVIVVEAGPWRTPPEMPDDFYGALRDLFDDWQSTVTIGRALWPVVQARAVGGTTVINSAICVRTPLKVIESWGQEHGLDARHYAQELERHQADLEREIGVEDAVGEVLGRHNELAIEGAAKLGHTDPPMRRFVQDCEGRGRCTMGCKAGRKQSMDLTLLPRAMQHGATVVSCAPVRKIGFEGRRASGVTGYFVHPLTRRKGASFQIRARRAVVLAASATHTPALMRRSGLKAKSVGAQFRAHPGNGVLGVYPDVVDLNRGATQGWSSLAHDGVKLETLALPLEMLAARLPGGGTALMRRLARSRHVSHLVQGLNATTVGRVGVGFGGRPTIRYTMNRPDLYRLRAGFHLLARQHIAAGATSIMPGIAGIPPELLPDEIDQILDVPLQPTRFLCILSHLFGGAVMGRDPKTSATDPLGRVWNTEGLIVACAAAIPTTLGVNPQHTIMALARMRAEEIVEDGPGRRPTQRRS
ncbi:MAG: GMC family oxidoreductase N-terminal domain-containing protein [Myxococcota bacterium]